MRCSTAGVTRAATAAALKPEIGQPHDLALAHGDAAEHLRQIFAGADAHQKFLDLAEIAGRRSAAAHRPRAAGSPRHRSRARRARGWRAARGRTRAAIGRPSTVTRPATARRASANSASTAATASRARRSSSWPAGMEDAASGMSGSDKLDIWRRPDGRASLRVQCTKANAQAYGRVRNRALLRCNAAAPDSLPNLNHFPFCWSWDRGHDAPRQRKPSRSVRPMFIMQSLLQTVGSRPHHRARRHSGDRISRQRHRLYDRRRRSRPRLRQRAPRHRGGGCQPRSQGRAADHARGDDRIRRASVRRGGRRISPTAKSWRCDRSTASPPRSAPRSRT